MRHLAGGVARVAAAAAGLCVIGGGAAVTTAAAAGPGRSVTSYVSEAGAGPHATPYRLGILTLALGLLLLALALPPALRLAAGLLGAAAVCAVLSATVPCSAGCPLPPYEPTTPHDLVHGTASLAAVASCVFAMLAVGGGPAVRSLPLVSSLGLPAGLPAAGGVSLAAAAIALPLSAVVGIGMLTVGRGAVVGITERVLLAVIAGWLCYLAASRVFAGPGVDAVAPSRS